MSLRVAVVGAGSMGMNHLRVLHDFGGEQMQLVGVADNNQEQLARAISRFHVEGYSDYRLMVERARPDLVAIVVPTSQHFEIARYMLEHSLHVLVEKPLASSVEQAQILVTLARRQGVKLAVGHIERFNPAIREVKRRLEAEELGNLFHLYARRIGPFPQRIGDVGVALDLATHDIDMMRYLTNEEILRVYALVQRRLHATCEDALFGMLHFANGVVGGLDVNWLSPTKIRELSITGEQGMYVVNYLTQDVYFYQNDYTTMNWDALRSFKGMSEGTMTRLKIQKAEPLRLEYLDVLAAILQDSPPTVSGEEGVAVLAIVHQLADASLANSSIRQWENVEVGVR